MILNLPKRIAFRNVDFVSKIHSGNKIHAITEDLNGKWQQGEIIEFCTGLGAKNNSILFTNNCISIQTIHMKIHDGADILSLPAVNIFIDGKLFNPLLNQELIRNEGFTDERLFMKRFFFKNLHGKWRQNKTCWDGKILHWTDFRY